ncbi:TPA_asm: tail related [Porphyromonas phage phage028a_KCOM2799]|uniref:Tail related n=1 Tax=Porphyromonas phage phage028a_KCOM2799 TaxID=3154118 RepID=A0AAT9J9B2_9CAUD|nr:hypothetical protein [Porphyromonas gingivalis]ATS06066.1 hypothetical protein CS387_03150 [Porphyromonas gingivalis]
MTSEILIVNSIKDGAGLSLSANSLALSKIKELQASSLPNKDALINSITSAVNVIVQKDQNNEIDYSNQNAPEIANFNKALGDASSALESDKKSKIGSLSAAQVTINQKIAESAGKITSLEAFQASQGTVNAANLAALQGLQSDMQVALKNNIEFFTGNYIPSRFNAPAEAWDTIELCKLHEGDEYTLRVDESSPPEAQGLNAYQYKFLRTVKGEPTSVNDFKWEMVGSGPIASLSASVLTLNDKVEQNNSNENFIGKVNVNSVAIINKVKEPTAALASQKLKADQDFKDAVTPKINPVSGKWKKADGSDSDNYAVADKVPAFSSAVQAANSSADNANNKATLAQQKADAATTAAASANEKASLANTAAANANNKATLAQQKADAANSAAASANEKASLANTAAANANSKATLAQQKADAAGSAAVEALNAKTIVLNAKDAGEFSNVRLFVDRVGDFRNGKVVNGIGGKVALTPRWFLGGVEKQIQGSGKTIKWYKKTHPARIR